jgi:hypothetical protein
MSVFCSVIARHFYHVLRDRERGREGGRERQREREKRKGVLHVLPPCSLDYFFYNDSQATNYLKVTLELLTKLDIQQVLNELTVIPQHLPPWIGSRNPLGQQNLWVLKSLIEIALVRYVGENLWSHLLGTLRQKDCLIQGLGGQLGNMVRSSPKNTEPKTSKMAWCLHTTSVHPPHHFKSPRSLQCLIPCKYYINSGYTVSFRVQ